MADAWIAGELLTRLVSGHIIPRTMKDRIACLLACILVSPNLFLAQDSTRGKAEVWGSLRVSIVDRATGQPVTARCYLTDSTQQSWSPEGAAN